MILVVFFDILYSYKYSSIQIDLKSKSDRVDPAEERRAVFMIKREMTITNNIGLHARPATFFIQKANSFKSSIWIEKDDRKVNAKSLLGVLSLGIAKGMVVTLVADGQDEKEALDGLVNLVQSGLAE